MGVLSGLFGPKVKLVKENPNPKVTTVEINQDFLGSYSKLVVTKSGAMLQYAPLAEKLMTGDVTRVDFAVRDGKTYVTMARKLLPWSDNMQAGAMDIIKDFLKKKTPPLYLDAISQNITTTPPFQPQQNAIHKLVSNTFNKNVNPVLADHGGAMELLNVEVKPTGEVNASVALIGSCNGCDTATLETLAGAEAAIKQALGAAKKEYSGNEDIKKLSFTGIQIKEIPEVALTR